MNIVICGAGEVGSHTAKVLADPKKNNRITVIDTDRDRLAAIGERLDVATFAGNCAHGDVLLSAGCRDADVAVCATDSDEVNLLTASLAKGIGARKTVARVHHSAFFDQRGIRYEEHLSIDHLICPEFSTAQAIARTLRNPGAIAIEDFGRGAIEMQEFEVDPKAPAVGKALLELDMPMGARLAVVTRKRDSFIPEATTIINEEDTLILVGDSAIFQAARRLFHAERTGRRRIVIMGGSSMAVWLCRVLEDRDFSIRLFVTDRPRAEQLAEKLSWVTVLRADPTDPNVFRDENIKKSHVFIALMDDEEQNILGCAWAKSMGVPDAVAVVQRQHYMHLLKSVGIDRPFSPRQVAVKEIENIVDESRLRLVSSLAAGIIDIYRVRVGKKASVIGRPLREIKLSPNWILAAIQQGRKISVPKADDTINANDTLLVVGRHGQESTLKELFATG